LLWHTVHLRILLPYFNLIMPSSAESLFEDYFKRHSLYSDAHSSIAPASIALRELVASDGGPGDACWGVMEFGKKWPQGIDFALQVYTKASSPDQNVPLLEVTCSEEYKLPLRDMIGNHAKYFQGGSGPEIGKEISWGTYDKTTGDACNLLFQKTDLQINIEAVIARTKNFQDTRLEIIVLQAIRGRSHAMNIVQTTQNSLAWIDFSLDPFQIGSPPWSKVDFIAACVLLRACAKSLLQGFSLTSERQVTLRNWKDKFSAFIHSDKPPNQDFPFNRDGDFVIKAHAAVRYTPNSLSSFDQNLTRI
jgi:hypothetical protein